MAAKRQYRRARQPEQKAERRRDLVAAATALLDELGFDRVTLNGIAAAAGVAKSNVYRYFESREEIFLALLLEEEERWIARVEAELAPLARTGDIAGVAAAMARTALAQPRLCGLTAALSTVMERNVSADGIARFKLEAARLSVRLGNALQVALPALPAERVFLLIRLLHACVAGLWPIAHPAPSVAEALGRPGLEAFTCDIDAELTLLVEGALSRLVAAGDM